MNRQEMEARLAELEAKERESAERAEAAERRAAEAEAKAASQGKPKSSGISMKVSENAKVLSIYGMQSRPISFYASQFVKLFAHEAEIKAFILANADALAWKTDAEKQAALASIRPAEQPTA